MAELNRRVVFEGLSKKGSKFRICYPIKDDAKELWKYINTLSKERTFLRFQGETISLEDEERYLNNQLQRVENKTSVHLLVFCNNKLIGNSAINMEDMSESHVARLGISLIKDCRGEGIGEVLMKEILKEAEKVLLRLRIVILGVLKENSVAQKMNKKLGFKEYGRLPEGSTYRGDYTDVIYMYKNIR
jgi:ribosomal protein S18 acetylase RimI-like enzyme